MKMTTKTAPTNAIWTPISGNRWLADASDLSLRLRLDPWGRTFSATPTTTDKRAGETLGWTFNITDPDGERATLVILND